jgi:perosamine synthetase
MTIPRFDYSFGISDALSACLGIWQKQPEPIQYLDELFPESSTHLVSSARQGIKLALGAFVLPEGASVGVQPYTCSSVLSAIKAAGHWPVFIDIDQSLTLSCTDLCKKIKGLDALIVTHTFGIPADIEQIRSIVGSTPVIEDCAHALFSQYRQCQVGVFFDAAVFSFGNGKFPSLGDGGVLLVNNARLNSYVSTQKEKMPTASSLTELKHLFKTYLRATLHKAVVQQLLKPVLNDTYLAARNRQAVAYNEKERQILRSTRKLIKDKLPAYRALSVRQCENKNYLEQALRDSYHMPDGQHGSTSPFAFVILEEEREELSKHLRARGIMAGKHFQHAALWAAEYGYQKGDCPTFDSMVDRILTIPCYHSLTKRELNKIIKSLLDYKTSTIHAHHLS